MRLAHRQRGAAAVFAAVAMVAAVAAFSLVFHIAQLYGAKRDLQSLANMAALDAAMVIGGCSDGQIADAQADAIAQAQRTLERNGGVIEWLNDGELVIGQVESDGGLRRVATASVEQSPRAVRVTLNRPSPALLTRAFGEGAAAGSRIVASASAVAGPQVALGVGSFLTRIQAGDEAAFNGIYEGLLGTSSSLTLSVAGYQGLLDAEVSLGDIIAASGAASTNPEEFITTQVEFGLGDFLQVIYDAAAGELEPLADQTLQILIDEASPTLTVLPDQIIEIAGDPNQLDDAVLFNVGELVNVAVMAANAAVPIDLAPLLDIPGLARFTPSLEILDPGEITVTGELTQDGDSTTATAQSAQVVVDAQLSLLGATGSSLLEADIRTGAVQGSADVVDVRCARPGMPYHEVAVDASTSLVSVDLSDVRLNLPILGSIDLGGATINVANATSTPLQFGGPDVEFPQTLRAPAVSDNVGTAVTNALAGLIADGLILDLPGPLQAIVQGVLDTVFGQLANPVLDEGLGSAFRGLGVDVSGADVTVHSVTVNRPRLITHEEG